MYHVRVTAATDLGANEQRMTCRASALNDILGFCGHRHMTAVAMQTFQLVCCVCKILKTFGVTCTTEHVTAT